VRRAAGRLSVEVLGEERIAEVVRKALDEGLTLAELARAVDADVGTVKSRLHRARENLRRALAPLRRGQPTTT
jgi:DNA-directed RNA polymerase specialized sigma24 family protein